MPVITEFDNQDWSISPVAPALGAPPARSIDQQKWVLNLTGVVIPNFKSGVGGSQWGRETIDFFPDSRTPLTHALLEAGVPIPPRPAYDNRPYLDMEQWTLFATINAIYDAHKAVDAGSAGGRSRAELSIRPARRITTSLPACRSISRRAMSTRGSTVSATASP